MPFRHLMFSKRNGAPQRNPDQQPISLDEAAYFSIDHEFSTYNRWPDHVDATQANYNATMQTSHAMKQHQQHPHQFSDTYDHSGVFSYGSGIGIPYQTTPYDFDSSSLQYSSDMMDTDVSSISRGSMHSSISGTSHLDIRLDEEMDNPSMVLSRKPSVISNLSANSVTEQLCPLIAGQVHDCSPDLCGPNAPCLEYINEGVVPPIEDCVPHLTPPSSSCDSDAQAIDFTTSQRTPQRQLPIPRTQDSQTNVSPAELTRGTGNETTTDANGKMRPRARKPITKNMTEAKDDVGATKQNKKSRARQAHSLVERKYRENLNAKIQELYLTLRRVRSKQPGSKFTGSRTFADDEDVDEDDLDASSLRVKKSDVLIEAMNYVHATEAEMKRKDEEIEKLSERIKMMEDWMRSSTTDANR